MTKKEARACLNGIAENAEKIWNLLLEFHARKGWKALGYGTIDDCVQAEFGHQKAWFYKQLKAAKLEKELQESIQSDTFCPSHAEALSGLESPEGRREVYQEVTESGPATAGKIEDAVARKLFDALSPEKKLEMMEAERLRYKAPAEQAPAPSGSLLPEQLGRLRKAVRHGQQMHQSLDGVGVEAEPLLRKLEGLLDECCSLGGIDGPKLRRAA